MAAPGAACQWGGLGTVVLGYRPMNSSQRPLSGLEAQWKVANLPDICRLTGNDMAETLVREHHISTTVNQGMEFEQRPKAQIMTSSAATRKVTPIRHFGLDMLPGLRCSHVEWIGNDVAQTSPLPNRLSTTGKQRMEFER